MNARKRVLPAVALAALLVAPALVAQDERAPEAGGGDTPDLIKSIIEQEIHPAPGTYTYVPANRRDPFVSLIKPVEGSGRTQSKKPGMEGFLIQEVALRGIVKMPQGFVAMFQGADGKSYFVKAGQRLYDGAILAVDQSSVTFRQDVADPLSPVKTREFKRTLNNETEEARQ